MASRASTVLGPILIVLGILLLAGQLGFGGMDFTWPTILILVGAGFLFAYTKSRRDSGSLFTGVLLVLLGSFFQLDQWVGLYMDEVWPFFPTAVGVAFIVTGIVHPNKRESIGVGFMLIGAGVLGWAITLGFFEWLLRGVGKLVNLILRVGIPLALIAWGSWLLLARREKVGGKNDVAPEKVEPIVAEPVREAPAPPAAPTSAAPAEAPAEIEEDAAPADEPHGEDPPKP